jgi:CheY-like chemotaxis protein
VKDPNLKGRRYPQTLREKGFNLHMVEHGPEAIAALMRSSQGSEHQVGGRYDLILIEAMHPNDREDLLLLEVLRRYLRWHHLPVILLVARPEVWTPKLCQTWGVAAVYERTARSPIRIVEGIRQVLGLDPPPQVRWGEAASNTSQAA